MSLSGYRRIVAFFGLLVISQCGMTEEHWQQPAYIAQSFSEIVMRNEFSVPVSPVRKWMKPIRVWVLHKVGDQALHQSLLEMHLVHLAGLSKRSISLVDQESDADVKVVFSRQDDFKHDITQYLGANSASHIFNTVCMANIQVNAKYEITKAAVVIPVDQAIMHRKLVSCIVEELTQIMGLPNDSEKVYPSIFNDKTVDDLLTGLDGLLIKLLYHPNVKAGMTSSQVLPIVHKVLKDWQRDGTITGAVADVKQGALYREMGF